MSRSEISRRRFLSTAIGGAASLIETGQSNLAPASAKTRRPITRSLIAESLIDRKALVSRHNPSIHKLDPLSPLSVGNGEFHSPRTSPVYKPSRLNMKIRCRSAHCRTGAGTIHRCLADLTRTGFA